MCLVEHAQHVIQELARTRDPDSRIPAIDSVVLLERLGLHRQAGRLLGQVVALVDASCLTQDLPWLGRVIPRWPVKFPHLWSLQNPPP